MIDKITLVGDGSTGEIKVPPISLDRGWYDSKNLSR